VLVKKLDVKVQYFGYIKSLVNKKEEHYKLKDDASLADLLNKLAGIHGPTFRKDIYEPGYSDVKTGFSVTVNGVFIGQLDGLNTKLADDDTIILMPLISGG
jgi:MoaD family protein